MSARNLYRFMIAVIIIAIVKLLISDDWGNAIALMAALVPLIQDLRNETKAETEGDSDE
jgi:ABC-type dipeptide/oligopeptide/nickel transport system ATPase component